MLHPSPIRYIDHFNAFPAIRAVESTRHGGVSTVPYASLNLGIYTDDDPEDVAQNLAILCQHLGINKDRLASSHQVHDNKVLHVETPGHFEGYDALITNQPDVFLAVTIADCTPILIFDPIKKSIAAVHAGWRGTVKQVVRAAIDEITKAFGTNPGHCFAYVGTCIDGDSYEVDHEVASHFPASCKKALPNNKFLVDLKVANKLQLLKAGIPQSQIAISPYSTFLDNEHFFSHRKEKGLTGRMMAVIGLKKLDT
ncbi:MAG TPA: peptidoglycan editing factor PgeF [Saprospiraceae bacterium]|nr:peptidoglycan editing factor PgeF [Saprospiraceae bacterium]HMQ85367.1 peptidoglycan editing factor PgeF [Saprospiraceae bacterium]